ncbi:heat-inducible transcriptional repressor HrcA [Calidifontibacillus erzurumensis]|uniref:Heat-inducible transcription repressor HrcA n=1 Tax=Calidifontibacillus erzurumensis TaxID=2741433 RepID=A0A8J8KAN6_9BACI|nr:heat-inducible transcriptional repressor HrcA [Calidifontibacillus erzurumensis]NSL50273.1 heat-inducible transcriptional repressor HrcA [Calidifontibacillus erzurumensis]
MLTERQLLILQVIIDDFIRSAQAVGSRTIAKKEKISFSPATIRNDMADLEEMGFIEKPHTSSGRIPSEKGYRFYVDHLLSPSQLNEEELASIRELFNSKIYEIEMVAKKSAKLLSEFTNYTTIVLGPDLKETRLKQIQIIPFNREKVVVIIVTDTGNVEHQTLSLPEGLDVSALEKFVNILNEHLKGCPIIELQDRIQKELIGVIKKYLYDHNFVFELMNKIFDHNKTEKVFYGGKTNMLSQPDFTDINKIRSLLSLIEQENIVYNLFKSKDAGISVKIGQENKIKEMQNCSVITATYSIGNEPMGTIAILGPTRMEYSRVITLLKIFSEDLSKALTSLYQNEM